MRHSAVRTGWWFFGRYGWSIIIGKITAVAAALAVSIAMKNGMLTVNDFVAVVLIAQAGAWGENVGCYGVLGISTFRFYRKTHAETGFRQYPIIFMKTVRSLLVEFGLIEVLDTLFIRPGLMGMFPVFLGNVGWGVLLGGIAADIIFYVLPILSTRYFPHWVRGD